MSNSHFSKFPQINLPRSRMKIDFNHKLSMMHGYLTPLECFPVVPGDSWDAKKIAHLVHMSTPIVPFMDNIDYYCRCFFVPLRLVWSNFEQFMGANKGAGYQTVVPIFPCCDVNINKVGETQDAAHLRLNLSHLLGKPIQKLGTGGKLPFPLSVLKERGYFLIWNSYFKAEQLQGDYPIDFGDGSSYVQTPGTMRIAKVLLTDTTTYNSNTFDVWNHKLAKVNKKHDFFVSCTVSPQYGPATTVGLADFAPVGVLRNGYGPDPLAAGSDLSAQTSSPDEGYLALKANTNINKFGQLKSVLYDSGGGDFDAGDIVADLTQATALNINTLRFGFAVQRYLERSNYGSNHFYEILAVHYGVTSPDARLQRPEYLGGFHFRINVDQVLNATGKTDTDQTQLGQKGAVSVTADRHFGFTKGFVEPGYIYVLAYTKQDRSYSSMVLKEDIKQDRFEFYSPEFANIGDQPVYRFELDASHTNDDIFGYQEAWSEYRYRPSRVSADLNPSVTGSMPYWTLADSYNAVPQLGPTWIQEDRDAVARALATGVNGPDFLVDFYMECVATRLMPVYSIPGLIDHVGSM